jgi:nucleotide-binding universal stress UspA family protein
VSDDDEEAAMTGGRIAVGFDGSTASRRALSWAVHEAARRRGKVLVVQAWETGSHPGGLTTAAALRAERAFLDGRLRDAVRAAQRELALARPGVEPPVIARELILADPMTALCHVARMADVVVVGTMLADPTTLARRLARRRRRFGGPCPLVMVVPDPAPAAAEPVRATLLAAVA